MIKQMKLLLSQFLIIFILLLSVSLYLSNNFYVEAIEEDTPSTQYDSKRYRDESFYRTFTRWINEGYEIVSLNSPLVYTENDSSGNVSPYTDISNFKDFNRNESITYTVNVSKSGLYELALSYAIIEEFYTNPEIEVLINNEVLFSESESINLRVTWDIDYENPRYTRYGDEMLPYSICENGINTYYFADKNSSYSTNYLFKLNEGENTIKITSLTHDIKLGNLFIYNTKELKSYSETKGLESNSKDSMIIIEAEKFISKNSLSIKQSYYKDPGMTPFDYKTKVLNVLDGGSTQDGGSLVTYEFNVENKGYYQICFKYLHSANLGVVSSKNILIDGSVPFKELVSYKFDSERKWTNHLLESDEGEILKVYLTEGKHTISLETTTSYQEKYLDELNSIMDWINSTGLNVKVITGGETSSIINQNIVKYLPTLEEDLHYYSERLRTIYDELHKLDDGIKNSSPELTCLNVAAKQLEKITKNVNRINSKLNLFCDGSGSAYQLIGDAVTALSKGPMDIDRIYLLGDDLNIKSVPKARSNIFKRIWVTISSFFYSFSDERYKLSNSKDKNTLNVWVEQSSLYADIIQNMADSNPDFDFKVKINVLPSVSKLVLSHSTNENPDLCISVDTWEPYSMALRGMLEDVSKYDGFNNLIEHTESGNFTPLIFEDGVYGIPEITSCFLLFYRKDILDSLNLTVPNTWEDVLEMLYTLQSYSMNFFHPLSSETSYKSFGMVTPFFYEFGAEVFSEDSKESTLEDEKTVEAMKFLTELYTVYNLPRQVSSFFESFRSGTIPIGVTSIDFYLQLQYAAPEIAGQFGVTVLPGMYNENTDRVERWSASYGKCSILFSNSKMKEEGWDFISWWNKTETQVEYLRNIKMTLGERYLVVPANLEALRLSTWDEEIKNTIIDQAKWSMTPAVTPGSYIVEREISQIYNKVVIDKVPLRQAISESVPKINRELVRKLSEFGYIDKDGNSSYKTPLSYTLNDWLKR